MSDTPRDCEHGQLARACRICELERELAAERERADRAKAEGIKEGMRLAAEIMRGRKVLASDFYYNLLLKEAGE